MLIFSDKRAGKHSGNSFNSSLARLSCFGRLGLHISLVRVWRVCQTQQGALRAETGPGWQSNYVVSVPALGAGSYTYGDKSRQVPPCGRQPDPPFAYWLCHIIFWWSPKQLKHRIKNKYAVICNKCELKLVCWPCSHKINNYTILESRRKPPIWAKKQQGWFVNSSTAWNKRSLK